MGKIEVVTAPAPEGVHTLSNGLPLCRFSLAAPKEWPVGQMWVDHTKAHQATCPGCIEAKKQGKALVS